MLANLSGASAFQAAIKIPLNSKMEKIISLGQISDSNFF